MDSPLEDLPNIGPALAGRLPAAGIMTAEEFLALGDEECFARLVQVSPEDACSHTRLALAGATRGIRWHALPSELRRQLIHGLSG
jgi:DNA transformation protein